MQNSGELKIAKIINSLRNKKLEVPMWFIVMIQDNQTLNRHLKMPWKPFGPDDPSLNKSNNN